MPITIDVLKRKIGNNEDVTRVNTCAITSMNSLFFNNKTFNQDIGRWDVSNVKDMSDHLMERHHLIRIYVIGMYLVLLICPLCLIMQNLLTKV